MARGQQLESGSEIGFSLGMPFELSEGQSPADVGIREDDVTRL